jgi:hypothetical protein
MISCSKNTKEIEMYKRKISSSQPISSQTLASGGEWGLCPISRLALREVQMTNRPMITKCNTSKSFGKTIGYVMNKPERYEVILCHGVSDDKASMIKEFQMQNTLNLRCKIPVFHVVLSHHPSDTAKIESCEVDILNEWLDEMNSKKGIDFYSTQFVIVKHVDRDHIHYHQISNLVSNNGKRLKIDHIGLKMKEVSKYITKKYGLTPAVKAEYQEAVKSQGYNIKEGIQQVLGSNQIPLKIESSIQNEIINKRSL